MMYDYKLVKAGNVNKLGEAIAELGKQGYKFVSDIDCDHMFVCLMCKEVIEVPKALIKEYGITLTENSHEQLDSNRHQDQTCQESTENRENGATFCEKSQAYT